MRHASVRTRLEEERRSRPGRFLWAVLSGMLGTILMAASCVGLFSTAASAATNTVSLSVTSGTLGFKGGTPTTLAATATAGFKGKETSTNGSLSTGTVTVPKHTHSTSSATTTEYVLQASGTSATGSVTTSGNVSIVLTIVYKFHISALGGAVIQTCKSSQPVKVVLTSTAPYTATSKSVTVKDSTITVPTFAATTCGSAQSTLNKTTAGPGGELGLTLHGTLGIPAVPAATSVTALSTTPASPQIQGTAVTLKSTVKKVTGASATAAAGSMTFKNGTTVLGTVPVSAGSASLKTSTLPVGDDSLTAVFSGGGGYKASTSAPVSFVVQGKPTVSVTGLPTTILSGTTTAVPFTVTVTNPVTGRTLSGLYLKIGAFGLRNQTHTAAKLQYEDSSSAWCTLLNWHGTNGTIFGELPDVGSSCTHATGASFSLAAGASMTVKLRLADVATTPTTPSGTLFYGTQTVRATLFTGTCTTSKCTASGILTSTVPTGSEVVMVVPASPFAVTSSDVATHKVAGNDFYQTFNLDLNTKLLATAGTANGSGTSFPPPTGTVSYTLTGTPIYTTSSFADSTNEARTIRQLIPLVATLPLGSHTLKTTYSPTTATTGKAIYQSSTLTEVFAVIAPPSGTLFTCSVQGATSWSLPAYVTAHGTVPAHATSGTRVTVTNVTVKVTIDPSDTKFYNSVSGTATFGFSPTGTNATAAVSSASFTGTTGSKPAISASWSGLHTSVAVTGGTKETVGEDLISFADSPFSFWTCLPATAAKPAPVGTITVIHHTPVTWTVGGCTSGSFTAPTWANTEEIIAKGAGGGGGGAAAYSTTHAGAGGAGGEVTTTLTIPGGTKVSAKTGCAGHGAPQGFIPGNGGAAGSGWSTGGHGGQGYYCAGFFCTNNDGSGGGGGGSTGVCNGSATCSSTSGTPAVVAGGGAGGGETMCDTGPGGNGGQAGNAATTSANGGAGLSGSHGVIGGPGNTGSPGGAGGANNKSSGSGVATGAAGGNGTGTDILGDSAGAGGGGAGYIGGKGGTKSGLDADCDAAGGGGGGSSWATTSGSASTSFGTGAAGGSRGGSNGSTGSVKVIFSYTANR